MIASLLRLRVPMKIIHLSWQAVDEKWRDFLDVLCENDVTVEYICED